MADHSQMKLGKQAVRNDPRTMRLAKYLPATLPPAEAVVDYSEGVTDWKMMLNDQLGCCTCAAACHAIQEWTMNDAINHPGMVTLPDSTVLDLYERWCGYVPNDPTTDNGGVELDILNHWRQEGIAGHTLVAYAAANPKNYEHVKYAISKFGGLYIGVELPVSAQNQDVWTVVPDDGGVWGGHAVYVTSYDDTVEGDPLLTCITWGAPKQMTLGFWNKYVSEAYALFGQDFEGAISRGPDSLDIAELRGDLAIVTA